MTWRYQLIIALQWTLRQSQDWNKLQGNKTDFPIILHLLKQQPAPLISYGQNIVNLGQWLHGLLSAMHIQSFELTIWVVTGDLWTLCN